MVQKWIFGESYQLSGKLSVTGMAPLSRSCSRIRQWQVRERHNESLAGLRRVLANQRWRPPDLFHLEWRGLVEFVDPVAEEQMCVAAPAVFRLAGRIVLRKMVAWRRD